MSKFSKCQISNVSMSNVIIFNLKKSHILIFDKKSDSWCIWRARVNLKIILEELTAQFIRNQAKKIASHLGLVDFNASPNWLSRFLERHNRSLGIVPQRLAPEKEKFFRIKKNQSSSLCAPACFNSKQEFIISKLITCNNRKSCFKNKLKSKVK